MEKRLRKHINLSVLYVLSAEMLQVCVVDGRDEPDEPDEPGQRSSCDKDTPYVVAVMGKCHMKQMIYHYCSCIL